MEKNLIHPLQKNIRLIITAAFLLLAHLSSGQVQIQTATATVSTCPNNGTITINATGNPPLLYSIIDGPITEPEQTSNVFNSLPPGNYTVRVNDVFGNEDSQEVTVSGSYTPLAFTPRAEVPSCPGGDDGKLIGNRSSGTGNGPFTWEILEPAAYVRGPQESETFENLPPGDYMLRVTDACQAFRTQTATVGDNTLTDIGIERTEIDITGCDEAQIHMLVLTEGLIPPFNLEIETPQGIINMPEAEANPGPNSFYITFDPVIQGLTYGDNIRITLSDACNRSKTINSQVKPFQFCPQSNTTFTDCELGVTINYNNRIDNCSSGLLTNVFPPLSFELRDVQDNVIIQSGSYTEATSLWGLDGVTLDPVEGGKTYEMTMTDGCGNEFIHTLNAPPTPTPQEPRISEVTFSKGLCRDSTATMKVTSYNFTSQPTLVITSGPSNVSSSKPDYNFDFDYSYPKEFSMSSTGPGNFYGFEVSHLGIGSYEFKIVDDCGNEITGDFEVTPEDVSDFYHEIFYKPGCLGRNQIHMYSSAPGGRFRIFNSEGYNWSKNYIYFNTPGYIEDSVTNIPPGTYTVSFEPSQDGNLVLHENGLSCPIVRETVNIEQYEQPKIRTYNALLCRDAITAEIIPDSSTGVPPYQYEIIAGPELHLRQNENIFSVSTRGTYTVRIYDDCGNASTREIHLEELTFEPLSANITCTEARIIYPTSTYYTYEWLKPDNSIYHGDTLLLTSITPADTGIYQVSQIVEISGCRDTLFSSHIISTVNAYEIADTICAGETYTSGSKAYTSAGIYTDTIQTALGCDSIVELHLTVLDYLRGTVNETICPGGNTIIANKIYDTPGTFYDTLSTATCDSILTINISLGDYLTGTVNESICPNGDITIGNHTYSAPGTYYDTLFTGTCDSILTINITQQDYLRSSVNETICPGGSITIGNKTYNSAGTYYDTLTTTSCDSIVTIDISIGDYLTGTVNESICPNGDITIGNYTYSAPGTYYDTLFTGTCDSILTVNITQLDYLRGSVNETICPGGSITIGNKTYNSPGTYSDTLATTSCDSILTVDISFGNYLTGTVNESICPNGSVTINNQTYSSAGTYYDTLFTGTCDSVVTININQLDYKRSEINESICPGRSITIGNRTYNTAGIYHDTIATTTCDSIVTINISVGDYLRNTITEYICPGEDITIENRTYSVPGTYRDTIPSANCDSIITINIIQAPAPTVNLGQDTSLCEGTNLVLDAGPAQEAYYWNDDFGNTTQRTLSVSNPGTYWVTVRNQHGCTSSDTMEVINILPRPTADAGEDQSICWGESVTLSATGGIKYNWRPENETQQTISVAPESTTTYSVVAYDANNCLSLPDEVTVTVHQLTEDPLFESNFVTHCFGEGPLTIGPTWGEIFFWPLTGDTSQYIEVDRLGVYSVEVSDVNGCPASGEIYVEYKCEPLIFIPDAFSPNKDGIHDVLEIFGKNFTNFEMRIFNRWGEVIFLTNDRDIMWDGTFRGDLMPIGSYPWLITYESHYNEEGKESKKQTLRGSVTLVR